MDVENGPVTSDRVTFRHHVRGTDACAAPRASCGGHGRTARRNTRGRVGRRTDLLSPPPPPPVHRRMGRRADERIERSGADRVRHRSTYAPRSPPQRERLRKRCGPRPLGPVCIRRAHLAPSKNGIYLHADSAAENGPRTSCTGRPRGGVNEPARGGVFLSYPTHAHTHTRARTHTQTHTHARRFRCSLLSLRLISYYVYYRRHRTGKRFRRTQLRTVSVGSSFDTFVLRHRRAKHETVHALARHRFFRHL